MNAKALRLPCVALGVAIAFTVSVTAQPVRVFPRPDRGQANPPLWINFGVNIRPDSTTGTAPPYTPAQVRNAYGFAPLSADGTGQTIAIVDAYDDSQYIQNDLAAFDAEFNLPAPPKFQIIYAQGSKPAQNTGWQEEMSLDVEWAHAIATNANILLVEAADSSFGNLLQAVQVAVSPPYNATVVSMSWGGGEFSGETGYDSYFTAPGVTYVASAGDSAEGVIWPAASPNVVAVGGTTLTLNSSGGYGSETAWADSGGGISAYEALPAWQMGWSSYLTRLRGLPDVSYLADPNSGVYVVYRGQWYEFGGTSVGAPQWAALFALANQGRGSALSGANAAIYSVANNITGSGNLYTINPSDFHDIASGNNGSDADDRAVTGYDLVTGVGSPLAGGVVPALSAWQAKPDFALSLSPSSDTVPPSGGTATYTVTMAPLNGFSDFPVALSLGGSPPSGATTTWSSSTLSSTSPSATLTVQVPSGTTAGSYPVSVTGTAASGAPSHTASATLVVAVARTTMTVSQIAYSTSGRQNANLNVTLTVVDNLGNPVANASVSITLRLQNTNRSWTGSGTTGSNGQVGFTQSNAPSGTYTTVVTSVTATGLTWDGKYPANSFRK